MREPSRRLRSPSSSAFLVFALASLLASGLAARPARAIDFHLGTQPLRLDLTESMYLSAHLDNGTPDPTDKNYGELINRLNAQLAWRKFLFSVRFDSGAWVHSPSDHIDDTNPQTRGIGDHSPYVSPEGSVPRIDCPAAAPGDRTCVIQPHDPRLVNREKDGSYTPYRFPGAGQRVSRGPLPVGASAFYLEKIALSYSGRTVEATLGDYYVNIGRGLVLSIRKVDELGVDTTLSGAKVIVHEKNFSGVALAGFTNVQNFDQAKAQFIPDPNDFISAIHVDYRFFDRLLVGAHAVFGVPACPTGQSCGEHDLAYNAYVRPGVMIDAPRLTRNLGVYAEYARAEDRLLGKSCEDRTHKDAKGVEHNDCGNALYGAANLYAGRTAWLLEAKAYDHYLPWHAANDPFGNLVYMQPPTLEQVITQINNNTDIVAGRLRLDVRVTPMLNLYWSGELGRTHPSELLTTTLVDFYGGAEIRWNEGRSHLFPVLGFRNEHQESNAAASIDPEVEERLYSVQWDAAQVLTRRLSLEASGLVWLRRKGLETLPGAGDNQWREGNMYVSLKWSPKLALTGGYEFTTIPKESANTHNFFNGSLLWNITSSTSLALFVGGNRPGLKCISGICRDFPAFQGARLEFVLRL